MNNQYRIVKIIDDTSLIINAGKENNIEIGDIMEIHGESENIFDPETKENLGKIDIIKDSLKVTKVYEKMCVCETSYVSTYFSTLLSNPLFSSTQKKLDVEPTDITGTGDKTIRVGDHAILIKKEAQEIKENNNQNKPKKENNTEDQNK